MTSRVSQLGRYLTNYYTSLYERAPTKFNRPLRIAVSVPEEIGIDELEAGASQNVPTARYYADGTITGTYTEATGFPSGSASNYFTYTKNVFDDAPNQGCLVARLRPQFASGASINAFPILFEISDGTLNHRIVLFYYKSSAAWFLGRDNGTSGVVHVGVASGHAADDSITLAIYWTATTVAISLNGAAFVTAANALIPTLSMTTFSIGGTPTGSQANSECAFEWVVIGNGTLSDAAIAALHALGDTDPEWLDLPEDYFEAMEPCFLWPGVDATHTPTAVYGENVYGS